MGHEKRKGVIGVITDTLELFTGRQSRKVAFGIWLFIVANAFKAKTEMPWDIWWKCVLLSGLLIGFGTVLDAVISKFGNMFATSAGNKVATIVGTQVNVVTDAQTPQP